MLTKSLPKYDQLPILTPTQLTNRPQTQSLLFYNELILNPQSFRHPGSRQILQPYTHKDISQVFHGQRHSFNAKLMLINLAIGRTGEGRGKGYQLWEQVKGERIMGLHDRVMEGLELGAGVLRQTAKLTAEEMEAFVTVPKYYANPSAIMFTDSKLQELWYLDRFWVSTTVFTLVIASIVTYLYSNDALFNQPSKFLYFFLGLLAWTGIEYYFHRILLHLPLQQGKVLNPHYIHHAFPNHPNKLALSITKNLLIQLTAYLLLTHMLGLQSFKTLHFILGVHSFMTLYDILHYYFHFGPEIQLPVLSGLKRNHMKHHYRDSGRGFGVTSVLWDWVFGTLHVK